MINYKVIEGGMERTVKLFRYTQYLLLSKKLIFLCSAKVASRTASSPYVFQFTCQVLVEFSIEHHERAVLESERTVRVQRAPDFFS